MESQQQRDFLMLDYGEDETKAHRSELVILDLATAQILKNFIDECRGNLIGTNHKEQDQGYLFPSKAGRCLAKSSMWLITRESHGPLSATAYIRTFGAAFSIPTSCSLAIGIGTGLRQAKE